MTETTASSVGAEPVAPTRATRAEQMFPTLTPAQLARITGHGRARRVTPGEVLVERGGPTVGDVRSGSIKREGSITIATVHQVLQE